VGGFVLVGWDVVELEFPREESRGRSQDLVGLLEISHLPLAVFHPLLLGGRDTRTLAGVDLGLKTRRRSDSATTTPNFGPITWPAA
jgi:hypothetical protein